jgi:SNF2 family DNA or RNA helicase
LDGEFLKLRGCSISIANLPKVISVFLQKDGLANDDVHRGKAVSFHIPLQGSIPRYTDPKVETVSEFTLARATAAQLAIPYLLYPPVISALFPYQRAGVNWLCRKDRTILADDMGLGKTLQTITAIRRLFFEGHISSVLVVCPKSLMSNWESELDRWAPDLHHVRMAPSAAIARKAWETVIGSTHILITTYEQMREPPQILKDGGIDLLVADEAHRIRNQQSLTVGGIRSIKVKKFWALTGTPIERDTLDLSTLLSIVAPKSCSPSDAKLSPALVRSIARPFILRRLKSEVLKQLPPVLENREVIELSPKQKRAYSFALESFSKGMDDSQMLALISKLRGICDYDPDTKESSKAVRIAEILSDIYDAGEKAIVFSHLTQPLHLMRNLLRERFGDSSLRMLLGEQSTDERRVVVADFKKLADVHFLLASSRVGSEGLTLTEANHVIFFNEWWNPSSNDQARDRVVRVGQKKGVLVYTFVCRHTIEETLLSILKNKRATFDDIVNKLAESSSSNSPEAKVIKAELRQSLSLQAK